MYIFFSYVVQKQVRDNILFFYIFYIENEKKDGDEKKINKNLNERVEGGI